MKNGWVPLEIENLPLKSLSRQVSSAPFAQHLFEASVFGKKVGEWLSGEEFRCCDSVVVREADAGLDTSGGCRVKEVSECLWRTFAGNWS
jgi:hypothetical protein